MPTGSTLPDSVCLRSLMNVSVIAVTFLIGPLSQRAVSMQWAKQVAGDAAAGGFRVDPPEAGAALRQVFGDRPVLQEVRAVVEDAAEAAFVDELLGKRDGRHAAIVVPDRVGTPAFSTASTISWPSAVSIDSGFSQRIILPASAAAIAISWCKLFGAQMSIASISLRSISLRQSVSIDA